MALEDALDRTMTDAELVRETSGAKTLRPELENARFDATSEPRRRPMGPPAVRAQGGEIPGLVPFPPPAEHFARYLEVSTQGSQRDALLMQRHQLGSKHRVIGHSAHAFASVRRIL